MVTLKTRQAGHWYKCINPKCERSIPLPDKLFVESDSHEVFAIECECGRMNFFKFSDAQDTTTKPAVDKFFGIKDPKAELIAYWEGSAMRHVTSKGTFMIFPCREDGRWKVRVEAYLEGLSFGSPMMLPEDFATKDEAMAAGRDYANRA